MAISNDRNKYSIQLLNIRGNRKREIVAVRDTLYKDNSMTDH